MTAYVASLRAVNVGGTGKLPMADLRAMGEELGFARVRTFIASGNLLFDSDATEAQVKARLETRLAAFAGKAVSIFIRTAAEVAAVRDANPFPDAHGSRLMVFFRDTALPLDITEHVRDRAAERLSVNGRELYVDYGAGIRDTRLKIPGNELGTGRNMNSVVKMAGLLAD